MSFSGLCLQSFFQEVELILPVLQASGHPCRSVKVYTDKSGLTLPTPQHCCWVRHVAIQINGFQVLQSISRLISVLLGEWARLGCTCLQKWVSTCRYQCRRLMSMSIPYCSGFLSLFQYKPYSHPLTLSPFSVYTWSLCQLLTTINLSFITSIF